MVLSIVGGFNFSFSLSFLGHTHPQQEEEKKVSPVGDFDVLA